MHDILIFLSAPFSSLWQFGNMLDYTGLLALCALGIAIAFRGGTFNLGGESQIYVGGISAAAFLLGPGLSFSPSISLLCAAFVSAILGAIVGGIPGLLRRYSDVNEMICSFLLALAITPIGDVIILGPLRGAEQNILASDRLPETLQLTRILASSSLNSFIFVVLLIMFLAILVLEYSVLGYNLKLSGANPDFARFAGLRAERWWPLAMALSGTLHALAGFGLVVGTQGICHQGFPGGLGWTAITVALVAANRPLYILPVAFAFSYLKSGSDQLAMLRPLPLDPAMLIQAIILLFVSGKWMRIRREHHANASRIRRQHD